MGQAGQFRFQFWRGHALSVSRAAQEVQWKKRRRGRFDSFNIGQYSAAVKVMQWVWIFADSDVLNALGGGGIPLRRS